MKWLLASTSPRRRELLRQVLPEFETFSPEVEEWEAARADPRALVSENAKRKALRGAEAYPHFSVLGSDTTVALGDQIFGKPRDREHAREMLMQLSGQVHLVCTGVCLVMAERTHSFVDTAEVHFRSLDADLIERYLDAVHVLDKAGAYGIQSHGDWIISRWEGAFSTIMGLPVERLRAELIQLGVKGLIV